MKSKEEMGAALKKIYLEQLEDLEEPLTIESLIQDIAETPDEYSEFGAWNKEYEDLDYIRPDESFHYQLVEDKVAQLKEIAKELGLI